VRKGVDSSFVSMKMEKGKEKHETFYWGRRVAAENSLKWSSFSAHLCIINVFF